MIATMNCLVCVAAFSFLGKQSQPLPVSDRCEGFPRHPFLGKIGSGVARFSTTCLAAEPPGDAETRTSSPSQRFFTDTRTLEHLVVASSLSYLSSSDGTMQASPYFPSATQQSSQPLLEPLVQVIDPKSESGVTVFRSGLVFDDNRNDEATTTTLVVAFRGSATPINFSTNLKFRLVPLKENIKASGGSEAKTVHEGFQDSSEGLWKLLEPELDAIAKRSDDPVRMVFTGHSLGAANALLCAARHQSRPDNDPSALSGVVTFGGPRLVSAALAEDWNASLFGRAVVENYVHYRDPILRQNGPLWEALGFGILGREVLCEHDRPVVYPDADPSGAADANLPVAWNILDHCKYLGMFVGPRLVR